MAIVSGQRRAAVSMYLQEIGDYPILSREEERAVAERPRGSAVDGSAHHDLIQSNLCFVVKIAHEYRNRGPAIEDLVNEGNLGLVEAVNHYDASRGTRFLTYAVWWIRKSILQAISRHAALVHVPGYQRKKLRSVAQTEHRLSRELGRRVTREEISRELQVTVAEIDRVLQVKPHELSLEDRVGREGSSTISDSLADERSSNPEDEAIRRDNEELLRWALGNLSDLERSVLVRRFGLGGEPVRTLQEIGETLGFSRERIRQLETQAMSRLKIVIGRRLRRPLGSRVVSSCRARSRRRPRTPSRPGPGRGRSPRATASH